jgi:hypothetical protein
VTGPEHSAIASAFDGLSRELEAVGVEAELCLVGGAVMTLAFSANPETRRARALFQPMELVRSAVARVADLKGLAPDWTHQAVRDYVGDSGVGGGFFDGPNVRVFGASPEYVLALKLASAEYEDRSTLNADIRYLARLLDLGSPEQVLEVVYRYFNDRQLPAGIPQKLAQLLA